MHTSSIYQITTKLKILVFINSCIQPIIIVGSTILVQNFVPSFRASQVHFELPSTFAIARYSRHRRIIPVYIQQQSTKVWYLEAHAMQWLSILEYTSYNCAVLWQISLLSGLFYEQCIFIFIQRNFLSKHDQIQNSITKVCFYCTADTLHWGCTETCQCTKTCHSGIHLFVSSNKVKIWQNF